LVETADPAAFDAIAKRLYVESRGHEVGNVAIDTVLVEEEPHLAVSGPEFGDESLDGGHHVRLACERAVAIEGVGRGCRTGH
jgi:hypothetical protein